MPLLWVIAVVVVGLGMTWLLRRKSPEKSSATTNVVLRDGREYVVSFDDTRITIRKRDGEVTNELLWADMSSVYALAIDRYPIGSISWMLHGADKHVAEVPTDAEGALDLFEAMQSRLQGFDNRAAIESAGMLHGFRKLWPAS
jgi:hypothetical protein